MHIIAEYILEILIKKLQFEKQCLIVTFVPQIGI